MTSLLIRFDRNRRIYTRSVTQIIKSIKIKTHVILTYPTKAAIALGRDVGWLGQKALWSHLENQDLLLYSLEWSAIQRMRYLME